MKALVPVFLAACALSVPSHAQSLFNVSLGTQITAIPDCDAPEGAGKICKYGPQKPGTPFDYYIELRPQKPEYLRTNFMAKVKDGAIVDLTVETRGLEHQKQILLDLKAAFGKPASERWEVKQNGFGAQFQIVEASWVSKKNPAGAVLIYVGANNTLTAGFITYSP